MGLVRKFNDQIGAKWGSRANEVKGQTQTSSRLLVSETNHPQQEGSQEPKVMCLKGGASLTEETRQVRKKDQEDRGRKKPLVRERQAPLSCIVLNTRKHEKSNMQAGGISRN